MSSSRYNWSSNATACMSSFFNHEQNTFSSKLCHISWIIIAHEPMGFSLRNKYFYAKWFMRSLPFIMIYEIQFIIQCISHTPINKNDSFLRCLLNGMINKYKLCILSWSWLNIWFEPMRWPVLGHVTSINSATTTCQPRPANHDLCASLAFELIRKRFLMPQYASKWRDYKVFDMETHIFLTF